MCLEWRRSTLLDTAWAPLTLMPWLCKPPSVSVLVSPCFLHWFLWLWHSSHTLLSVLHSCGNVYLSREWLLSIHISIFHPVSPALDLHGSAIPCIWPTHLLDLCPLPFASGPHLYFMTLVSFPNSSPFLHNKNHYSHSHSGKAGIWENLLL